MKLGHYPSARLLDKLGSTRTNGRRQKASTRRYPYTEVVATRAMSNSIREGSKRFAVLLGRLVCGAWGLFVLYHFIVNGYRPERHLLYLVLFLGFPVTYFVPYGLVKAIGWVVEQFARSRR